MAIKSLVYPILGETSERIKKYRLHKEREARVCVCFKNCSIRVLWIIKVWIRMARVGIKMWASECVGKEKGKKELFRPKCMPNSKICFACLSPSQTSKCVVWHKKWAPVTKGSFTEYHCITAVQLHCRAASTASTHSALQDGFTVWQIPWAGNLLANLFRSTGCFRTFYAAFVERLHGVWERNDKSK